jgi:hypothetical protein
VTNTLKFLSHRMRIVALLLVLSLVSPPSADALDCPTS